MKHMKIFTLFLLFLFASCSAEKIDTPPPASKSVSEISLPEPLLVDNKTKIPQNTLRIKNVVEKKEKKYQTSFSIEQDIKNSVEIPKYVFDQIIKADKDTYGKNEQQKRLKQTSNADYINLNNDNKPDLIVIGDLGANIGGFWIFRNIKNRWQLILETRTHSLDILKTKTNGYYRINITAMSAVTLWESVYKFNNENYLAKDCYETDLSQTEAVRKYFSCSGSTEKPYR